MKPQSLHFRVVFLAASALLVGSTFLVYLIISDKPPARLSAVLTHPAPELADLQSHLQPPEHEHDLRPSIPRVWGTQVSAAPPLPLLPSKTFAHSLGVASEVFVLSLPRRLDRRMSMDALSHALDFNFVYVDGVEAADASIDQILRVLRLERHIFRQKSLRKTTTGVQFIVEEGQPGAHDLDEVNSFSNLSTSLDAVTALPDEDLDSDQLLDLPCATPEDPFPPSLNITELGLFPSWRILSRGMIACWIGHLNIMQRILKRKLEMAIVLEDDVDLEYDVSQRLVDMWPALPQDGWDIVMLGHCHSNESIHPPLSGAASLHPSYAPKCTHAYAISHAGAKKLSRLLSAPGFAYSRALDQAISWLISTGRIRSYSVVPAIVVQSKRTVSDIWRNNREIKQLDHGEMMQDQSSGSDEDDKGSKWRDVLMDSTLERLGMMLVA